MGAAGQSVGARVGASRFASELTSELAARQSANIRADLSDVTLSDVSLLAVCTTKAVDGELVSQ